MVHTQCCVCASDITNWQYRDTNQKERHECICGCGRQVSKRGNYSMICAARLFHNRRKQARNKSHA